MLFIPLLLALGLLGADAKPHRPISRNHLRHAIAQRAPTELMHSHTKRFSGSGTFYDTTENLSACGVHGNNEAYVVALNSAQYGGGYPGPNCFKTLTISSNGVTIGGIQVIDECPTCAYGDLDLSPGLFRRFADEVIGVISISWEWDGGGGNTDAEPTTTTKEPEPTPEPTHEPSSSSTTTTISWTSSTTTSASSSSWSSSSSSTTLVSSTVSLNATASHNSTISSATASRNVTSVINTKASSAAAAAKTGGLSVVTGEGGEDTGGQGVLGDVNSFVARVGHLILSAALG